MLRIYPLHTNALTVHRLANNHAKSSTLRFSNVNINSVYAPWTIVDISLQLRRNLGISTLLLLSAQPPWAFLLNSRRHCSQDSERRGTDDCPTSVCQLGFLEGWPSVDPPGRRDRQPGRIRHIKSMQGCSLVIK